MFVNPPLILFSLRPLRRLVRDQLGHAADRARFLVALIGVLAHHVAREMARDVRDLFVVASRVGHATAECITQPVRAIARR